MTEIRDEMGRTQDDLLRWMMEVAEAKMEGCKKIVNLKFTRNTLAMWIDRVKEAISEQYEQCEGVKGGCEEYPDMCYYCDLPDVKIVTEDAL